MFIAKWVVPLMESVKCVFGYWRHRVVIWFKMVRRLHVVGRILRMVTEAWMECPFVLRETR